VADVNTIASYIYNRAREVGVNPNLALGIARYEGLNPNTIGSPTFGNPDRRGYSFGPFQLYSGSSDPTKIAPGGMAYDFQQRFGEAPSASNWQKQVDFALDTIRSRGTSPWYAVRDQGGPEAITQKGEKFATQIGLDRGEAVAFRPRPLVEDTNQVSAPQPAAVYSQDVGTSFRRLGNFLAPDWVAAPEPLTAEQAAVAQRTTDRSFADDPIRAFQAIQEMGMRQEAAANRPASLLQPSVVRGQFRPISMGRGLL
jgi:hypothetical protein